MLDVAWPELMVIGAVALVAVGPKDLPKVMHALGRLAARARAAMYDLRACIDHLDVEAERAGREKRPETDSEADRDPNA